MSNIVIYNPSGIVPNMVTSYLRSVNTPDYESLPYILINPDISVSAPVQYWKVVSDAVVEMANDEKTVIDNKFKSKTIREKLFNVDTYDVSKRLIKEVWYDTDNKDGTYSGLVEETIFTYLNVNSLEYKIVTVYFFDGSIESSKKIEYFRNENLELIEKTTKL